MFNMCMTHTNSTDLHTATRDYIDALPDAYQVPLPNCSGYAINRHKVDELTDEIQLFVANVVAALIDAGSEREAVIENEVLRDAIRNELQSWSDHPDNV